MAHLIDNHWQLQSFVLGIVETEEWHFAASHFTGEAKEWEIMEKVTK